MSDDGGNARKGKLQIGHMYATQIDVVGFYETVVGIIDAKILQNVERGDEHTATAATGIAYCDDFVFVDFFPNNRFVYGHPCHKFRDMIGREELSCGFVAEFTAHKDLAEVVVEFTVVVNHGREQSIDLGEYLRKFLLQVGFIAADNAQISFLAFVTLGKIDLI